MEREFLETFFTPTEQSILFLYSVLLGVALSIVFDLFRVIRTIIPHRSIMVAIEDILFCVIWGLSVFVFSVELSRGEVRGYYFLGNLLGFLLCHYTIGNVIVNAIRKIFSWIYRVFLAPIVKLLGLICQKAKGFFVGIYSKFKNSVNKRKIPLKHDKKMMYNNPTHKIGNKIAKKDVKRRGKTNKKRKEKRPF